MKDSRDFLTRHRNTFLLCLLAATVIAGSAWSHQQAGSALPVSIPMTQPSPAAANSLEAYRQERDAAYEADTASLHALCNQADLDHQTREDAARRLESLVSARQAQLALEGALMGSALHPCVAVVTQSSVTIVTQKQEITQQDAALVLTLADAHAATPPSGVRIITTE